MNHTPAEPLIMLAVFDVKPDKVDDFLAFTTVNLNVSRAAPGNISFDMLIDDARPTRILFYEIWDSAEAQQAYMTWRVEQGDLTTLLSFLASPPEFTALRRISA